jgi:adenosylcobyric acid synthase
VLPYLNGLALDEEDALPEPKKGSGPFSAEKGPDPFLRIAVPVYPRISNHTDFDALRLHRGVEVILVGPGDPLPAADLVILPGSKNVRADLDFLKAQGWGEAILRHVRYGGRVIGICGGMQMLGTRIHDPHGVEGPAGSSDGLGLLQLETVLGREKELRNVSGRLKLGAVFHGYEIHMGTSQGTALERPAASIDGRPEGAMSADGRILATYVHGVFDAPAACAALLDWAGMKGAQGVDLAAMREASLERLADCVEENLETGYVRNAVARPPLQ